MVKKIEKIPMQKLLFSAVREPATLLKIMLSCRYFATILTRNTEQLFRRTLLNDYSENIKTFIILVDIVFIVLFLILGKQKVKGFKYIV